MGARMSEGVRVTREMMPARPALLRGNGTG
jgi:hypothetical protein